MAIPKHKAPEESKVEETAFLVFINEDEDEDSYVEAEMEGLCEAAGLHSIGSMRQRLDRPYKKFYLGTGKVDELKMAVADLQPDVVILDCELSGIQLRNLGETVENKVVDRTQLILDIFARRAKSREGQLQVELAQLTYMMPRLMSVYTKFERQRGGIGMRGPGETKLESDRRLVRDKISKLGEEIEEVKRLRDQQRIARRKNPFPFATIVGYTSAGKSTLMNRFAGTDLLADAMPFATLDPTTRKVDLNDGYAVFLTDTVGFIRKLPTHLVAAFRSTMEEVSFADFIVHVIDASIPDWDMQRDSVLETLENLGAGSIPTLTVFNKIDLVKTPGLIDQMVEEWPNSVGISSLTGAGFDELQTKLVAMVQEHLGRIRCLVPYAQTSLVDDCYKFGRVLLQEYREDGIYIEAEVVSEMRFKLAQYEVA